MKRKKRGKTKKERGKHARRHHTHGLARLTYFFYLKIQL
jgi:hypothetical protein